MAYLPGWDTDNRVKIIVDNTNIDSNLTHFAVPIVLGTSVGQDNQDVSRIFDELGSNSKKIAITKDDGTTEIYGEIEHWDSVNEKAVIWVSKSGLVLSSTGTTDLFLYYDSTHADNDNFISDTAEENTVTNIIGDDFTGDDGDPPNKDLWVSEHGTSDSGADASGVTSIQGNSLDFSVSAAVSTPYIRSNFVLSGDFDIQVDFSIDSTPSPDSNWMMGLRIGGEKDQPFPQAIYGYMHRETISRGPYRAATNGITHTSGGPTDLSGKFRMTRTGTSLTMQYWGGSSWIIFTTDASFSALDMYVFLYNRMWVSGGTLNCNFDNFQINSGTVKYSPSQRVHDDNFKAVYHMAQDPSGGTDAILDSTSNANHGTSSGSMTSGDLVDGEIGKALDFDGVDDAIVVSDHSGIQPTDAITFSTKVNRSDWSVDLGDSRFISCVETGGYGFDCDSTTIVKAVIYAGGSIRSASFNYSALTSGWHLFTCTYDGTNLKLYVDGVLQDTTAYSGTISYSATTVPLVIAAESSATTAVAPWFDDKISFVDVSNLDRSAAWIKATNYSLKDDLLTFDFEDEIIQQPIITILT